MGGPFDAGGLPIGDPEFLGRVRTIVGSWQERLAPATRAIHATSIGRQAEGLAATARARGLGPLAAQLEHLARLARSPDALAGSVAALAQTLPQPNASPPKRGLQGVGGHVASGGTVAMAGPRREVALPSNLDVSRDPPLTPPPLIGMPVVATGDERAAAATPDGHRAAPGPHPATGFAGASSRGEQLASRGQPRFIGTSILNLGKAFGRAAASPLGSREPGPRAAARAWKPAEAHLEPPELPALSIAGSPAPLPRGPRSRGGNAPPAVRASPWASKWMPRPSQARDRAAPADGVGKARRQNPRHGAAPANAPAWLYLLAGFIALMALALVVLVVLVTRRPAEVDGARPSGQPAAPVDAPARADVPAPLDYPGVHEQGEESPQLRALIDTQARLAEKCRTNPSTCGRRWTAHAREVIDAPAAEAGAIVLQPPSSPAPLAAWLKPLRKPKDFPLWDDPLIKGNFDRFAYNIAGHAQFQSLIFRCSAYGDIFEAALEKYGAPKWLSAVVFQESGCYPAIASDAGAKGLWQFMPESARIYGLQVIEDEIDERLNPMRSTDAGVHFLTDLQRKFGAWDLALAAYNMGPFALAARIAQLGGHAQFWDLVRGGLLPDETVGYVPAIEAYALIAANLPRLQFSQDGPPSESTVELRVKSGTRLSLIARAAHTSTRRIRELNPEFLQGIVSAGASSARIPLESEVPRAREFFAGHREEDKRDMCVPDDFDWGASLFDPAKFPSCEAAHASLSLSSHPGD